MRDIPDIPDIPAFPTIQGGPPSLDPWVIICEYLISSLSTNLPLEPTNYTTPCTRQITLFGYKGGPIEARGTDLMASGRGGLSLKPTTTALLRIPT